LQRRLFALVSAILVLAVALSALALTNVYFPRGESGTVAVSDLGNLSIVPSDISISGNTIYINSSITVPVEMGIMMPNISMYSFMIWGHVNPKLVIQPHLHIDFMEINVDNDSYHSFAITGTPPPYPYMAMSTMMNGGGFLMDEPMLPPQSGGIMHYSVETFTSNAQGTFWYICTYPGHAENGMYGEIQIA